MNDNPYKPPVSVDGASVTHGRWIVGFVCFWVAFSFSAVGTLSLFVRNAPPLGWFLLASVSFLSSALFSRKGHRMLALVGLVLCLFAAAGITHAHYQNQRLHQKYLELRETRNRR